MKPTSRRILTVNGGSSSIKFALFDVGDSFRRILKGGIDRIGLPDATFSVKNTLSDEVSSNGGRVLTQQTKGTSSCYIERKH